MYTCTYIFVVVVQKLIFDISFAGLFSLPYFATFFMWEEKVSWVVIRRWIVDMCVCVCCVCVCVRLGCHRTALEFSKLILR